MGLQPTGKARKRDAKGVHQVKHLLREANESVPVGARNSEAVNSKDYPTAQAAPSDNQPEPRKKGLPIPAEGFDGRADPKQKHHRSYIFQIVFHNRESCSTGVVEMEMR